MIQLQALNYILSNQDMSLVTVNNMSSEFFTDYRQEFDYILEHYTRYGNCPDIHSFVSKFPDFDVVSVNESSSYIVDELYQDYNKRKLAKVFNRVRELINQDKIDEAMKVYTSAASDVVQSTHLDSVDIFQDTSRYDDYIEKCKDYDRYYVKTGFKELDDLIGGWDREEELGTVVARPGVGKSWVLHKIAVAAAEQGLRVGIYSGEMSENKVGYRIDTLISHIPNSSIMKGNDAIQLEYKKYMEELPHRFKGTIKVLTPAMINGMASVTALRAFVEKEKLDILCVDQHSLLEDERRGSSPVEKASNISKDLKKLQVLKKIPIISVSQQNRDATLVGHNTATVAQTDRIAQDSTVLIFLDQKKVEGFEAKVLTLTLVKARDSVAGASLQYAIDLNRGLFQFIPTEGSNNETQISELMKEFEGEDAF